MANQPSGRPIDILLVEDNPGDVRLTREAFEGARIDASLTVANDGKSALEYLDGRDDAGTRPDLVLLDLDLPRMDGLAVLAEIRDTPGLRTIPVIVLTSSTDMEDVERSYEGHANAYLTKPSDPAEFVELARAVGRFWIETVQLPPR